MELECVLLGLISMRPGVTGYELNRIMRESTGYLVASLSHIYPALRRLHDRGLVTYSDVPIKNRLAKKMYSITPAGEALLREWLAQPVEARELDVRPFLLKMAFSPLMDKASILAHMDREIARLERYHLEVERGIDIEIDYLDKTNVDPARAGLLWSGLNRISVRADVERLGWLKEWRAELARDLVD